MQQIYLPPLTKINKGLLIALVASFILTSLLSQTGVSLYGLLSLSPSGLKSGYIWQLFTYPLMSTGLMEVVFTGLLLWFIGSELERLWGARKYIAYLLMTTVVSAVFFLILSTIFGGGRFSGMSFLSSAMCVSYAVLFPDRIFQFFMVIPIKAKFFCMILGAMSLYQGLLSSGGGAAMGQLAAMGFGFVFIKILPMPWFNKLVAKSGKASQFKGKKTVKKSHLRIVEDEKKDDSPRYWQ